MKTIIPYLATTCAVLVAATLADAQFRPVDPMPIKPMPIAPITSLPPIDTRPITSSTPIDTRPITSSTPSSVTIQVTPTPDVNYHPPEGHHHPETPTPAPPMAFGAGERYPQTRTRPITEEDAAAMNYAELRYAINEVYARHGADFPTERAIANRFRHFEWYHPRIGVLMSEIENEFSETERANVKVLARYRDQRWASGER